MTQTRKCSFLWSPHSLKIFLDAQVLVHVSLNELWLLLVLPSVTRKCGVPFTSGFYRILLLSPWGVPMPQFSPCLWQLVVSCEENRSTSSVMFNCFSLFLQGHLMPQSLPSCDGFRKQRTYFFCPVIHNGHWTQPRRPWVCPAPL